MKLDAEQITKIGIAFNHQFSDLNEQNPPVPVVLFENNDFLIKKYEDNHVLQMKNYSDLKDVEGPEWLTIHSNQDTQIIFPNTRLSEITFLLRKSFEDWILDVSLPYTDSVASLLKAQVKVWKKEGEPLRPEQQRGLLGEFYTLVQLVKKFGPTAIHAWDETSTNAKDFSSEDWQLEAKSKSPQNLIVKISSKEQLFHQDLPLYLTVLDVSKNMDDGMTLPDIIEKQVQDLIRLGVEEYEIEEIRISLDTYYQIFSQKFSFISKWSLGDFKCYSLPPDSVPCLFSASVPNEITFPTYHLHISCLDKSEFLV